MEEERRRVLLERGVVRDGGEVLRLVGMTTSPQAVSGKTSRKDDILFPSPQKDYTAINVHAL